jgi:hypothetical protein
MTSNDAVYVEQKNGNTTTGNHREITISGDEVVVEDTRHPKTLTPERYMVCIDVVLRRLKEAEQQLQESKDFMEKRLETGYEHYEQKSINSMCNALAIIKQQDVSLMQTLNYKIKY